MALILSIDTAMENAGLCLADNSDILSIKTNNKQTEHATWLHTAIREALREASKQISELKAVMVTSGPGSYTGLRVGMASAKGLCYALTIPLITESTLHLIAYGAKKEATADDWICPMIDARRMEVFTTLYDNGLNEKQNASALILDEHSFQHIMEKQRVIFCGNGSIKWRPVCHHPNAVFSASSYTMEDMAGIAFSKFTAQDFRSIAYSEPSYLKNVYMGTKDA